MLKKVGLILLLSICLNAEDAALANKFRILVPQHCMFGDFDLLVHDTVSVPKQKILLSVKNLDTNKEVVFPALESFLSSKKTDGMDEWRKKVSDLYKDGAAIPVNNNPLRKAGTYLISVCSDVSNSKSCSKKVEDIAALLNNYKTSDKTYVPGDHVYYQQVIKSDGKTLTALDSPVTEASRDDVKDLLKDLKNSEAVIKDLEVLKSMPIKVVDKSIMLALPVYSPKKCGKS